ncbi:MAG: anaerobic carbon-monoxide dehydrogenase catalytic subunit [Candidatus Odinarchaeota archaeon]
MKREIILERTIDTAAQEMLEKAADEHINTAWDRYELQEPQCGYGLLGICCRNCAMGPCRIDPFGNEPQKGVCGADADTIVARNLARMIAGGAAAHSDHGRDIVEVLHLTAEGKTQGYQITDEEKLKRIAQEYRISTDERPKEEIAKELAEKAMEEYGMIKNTIQFAERVPEKRKDLWKNLGIWPRSIDREIVEIMHRTHIGVGAESASLLLHGLRASLSDGWGGSMLATEFSDILWGTPKPKESTVSLGVLKEDHVNIIVHGHNPVLSEVIVDVVRDPEMIELAKQKGATGINIAGICCTSNELLMRKGIPVAGNFLVQELALISGAVDAMVVDYQCLMPSLPSIANCYHSKIITTSPKAQIPGATHIEFDPEHAYDIGTKIVKEAIEAYENRNPNLVRIPKKLVKLMAGFSAEAILEALGGTAQPLIDAIVAGKIRGIAAVVGCNNPKIKHDFNHVTLTKRLIENDILVVETGCAAIANAKAGLLVPEAADQAGEGLKEVAKSLGIPPVLHMGSCVDISRILNVAAVIAKQLNVDISDLPVAGAAPEWMSEKAVSIGAYVVSSGIFTVLGAIPPVLGSKGVTELLTQGLKNVVGATFAVEPDPEKEAELIINHINEKRKALGLKETPIEAVM